MLLLTPQARVGRAGTHDTHKTNLNPGQDTRAEPKLEGHRHQIEHSVGARTQALTETHMYMHMYSVTTQLVVMGWVRFYPSH